jgi:putative hydrolase of the HAD superfamily
MRYKHIFFDLDDTLWDSRRNSGEAIREIFSQHRLDAVFGLETEVFVDSFHEVNYKLWDEYSDGKITQEELRQTRFPLVFNALGLQDTQVCASLQESYMHLAPRKPHLMPHALELLDYLKDHYTLHIITNGFDDVQLIKLRSGGIDGYFNEVVTSLRAGCQKPNRKIFEFARRSVSAQLADCLMVGDNLRADIAGAANAGMDHVFYNPDRVAHQSNPTYEIHSLREMMDITPKASPQLGKGFA